MPSGNVLRGARVTGRPVPLGACGGVPGLDERPVYSERAHREGCEAARAAGQAEGEARAAARLRREAELLKRAAAALEAQRLDLLQSARAELVRLAVVMTERLTRRVLEVDAQVAERALAEAIERAGRGTALTLRFHPEDAARLRDGAGAEAARLSAERFTLIADESVGRGGCLLETPALRLDATLETHLDRMAEALCDWRDEAPRIAAVDAPVAARPRIAEAERAEADEEVADAA